MPRCGSSLCQSICQPSLAHSSAEILAVFSGVGFGVRCTTSTLRPNAFSFCSFLTPTLVTCVHPQMRKAGNTIVGGLQHQLDAVLIRHLGAVDFGLEHQPFRIHQEMALSATYLLSTYSRPCASPPTPWVVLADCEPTIPALDCGFLPSLIRKRSRSAAFSRSQVPSMHQILK
jgi:hypothetical protein